jgi:hypothetical protein
MNLFKGKLKFLGENNTFPKKHCIFFRARFKFSREIYVPNFFAIVIVTFHWKGFEKSYNFISGITSIRIHMQKLWSNKILNKERLKFPREIYTYVLNFLEIIVIAWLFLYILTTYYWKAFKESYNFVVGSTSIVIHMQKICSHKVSNTIVFEGTWLLLKEHKQPCSPESNCAWNFVWT